MSERENRKRKSKSWYRKQAFKQRKRDGNPGHRLTAGLKGFIITCNDRERDAVKESYNILNEYADKIYGPERKEEVESEGESEEDDIEAAVAKEVKSLKEAATSGERRFQNSLTGAKNCIFIKTTLDDPVALAHAIFSDLRKTKQQKSRYALRLLPVVGTCRASVQDINDLAKKVLQPFFTDKKSEVTFAIDFKARNNNGVGRDMTIATLRETIKKMFPSIPLQLTYSNPQITILVEVMCGVACIAVAKDFAFFRKYNLLEVTRDKPAEENSSVKSEDPSVKLVVSTERNSEVLYKDASITNVQATEENNDIQTKDASKEQTADNQDAVVPEDDLQDRNATGSVIVQSNSCCEYTESASVEGTDKKDAEYVAATDTASKSDIRVSAVSQQERPWAEYSTCEVGDSGKAECDLEVSENAGAKLIDDAGENNIGDKLINAGMLYGEEKIACPMQVEQEPTDIGSHSGNTTGDVTLA